MKNKILMIIVFLLFTGSVGYIFGTAGASDYNLITLEQCFWRVIKGLIVLVIDALIFCYLASEDNKKIEVVERSDGDGSCNEQARIL